MSPHEPFDFRSSDELLKKASDLGIMLPFQTDLSPLFQEMTLGTKKLANRLAVQPMEGYDANPDGSPSDLTFRRYRRFASGGSALIWFEATSVVPEGRSNTASCGFTGIVWAGSQGWLMKSAGKPSNPSVRATKSFVCFN